MKVLVTGATGFLGARVVTALASHDVIAPSRADLDLADTDRVAAVLAAHRPDTIVHLAWYAKPPTYWAAAENLDSLAHTLSLLRLAHVAGVRRFVGAGTCAEYDWRHARLVENVTPCVASSLYGAAKLAACTVGERFAATTGMSFAWARYGFLFGPGDGRLIASAIETLSAGGELACSPGTQIRDFVYVADAAAATVALATSDVTGPVNVGSGEPFSVRAIVEMVAELVGGHGRPVFGALPPRPGDPPELVLDLARLTTEVGWRPAYSVRERIAELVRG